MISGFDNSYAQLPARFYARLAPTPVAAPQLVKINYALATELGLDAEALATPEGIEILAGNRLAEGSAGEAGARRSRTAYVTRPHSPGAAGEQQPYRARFERVIARQAELVARWLLVGFIHGVMNTDNTSIAGETIAYGPCAFMDEYHQGKVFSSIDQQGRYAYANQPQIAMWNLARFAETLLPLIDEDQQQAIEQAQ